MEELFAYIFRIYKKFGGNNPSILATTNSVTSDCPTIIPKIALNGVKMPQFPNLLNQGWIELNFQ